MLLRRSLVPPVLPICRTSSAAGKSKPCTPCTAAAQDVHQQDTAPLLVAQEQYGPAFKGRIAPCDERSQTIILNTSNVDSLDGSNGSGSNSQAQRRRRRATVDVRKLLTNRIAAADTLEELHDILAAHGRSLDHIHVAKLLCRTSQIRTNVARHVGGTTALQDQAIPQLDQQQQADLQHQALLCSSLGHMMGQRLCHSTAVTLVSSLASLGRLAALQGSSSSSNNAEKFAIRATELLPTMSMSQITVIMWALAKLGFKPSSSWVQPVLAAFIKHYETQQQQQQQQKQPPQNISLEMQKKQLPLLQQRPVLPPLQLQHWPGPAAAGSAAVARVGRWP